MPAPDRPVNHSTQLFWCFWAERAEIRFADDGFLFGIAPNAWLREHAGIWQPGQRVLCVADGEGRNSVWLARRGLLVDAFDIAEVALVAKALQFAEILPEGEHLALLLLWVGHHDGLKLTEEESLLQSLEGA